MLEPAALAALEAWRTGRGTFSTDEQHPWALPLVVRVEKDPAPTHTDTLEAAAAAVLALLTHPCAAPDGPWHAPLARWMDGRIRKVSRRARGAKWDTAAALPGATVTVGTASVAALMPHPVGDAPAAVSKLQVSGLELTDPTAPADPVRTGGPALSILLNPRVQISTGKACAQVGHAAQVALMRLPQSDVLAWASNGFALTVRTPNPQRWDTVASDTGPDVVVITDAGFTEVDPGTVTCAATLLPTP